MLGDALAHQLAPKLLVLLLVLAWVYRRFIRTASRYITVGGKSLSPRPIRLGRARTLAWGFVLLYFFLTRLNGPSGD